MSELKPCPFCGSSKVDDYFIRDGRRVACGCGASMVRHHGPSGDTKADVRAAWNTRAALPAAGGKGDGPSVDESGVRPAARTGTPRPAGGGE